MKTQHPIYRLLALVLLCAAVCLLSACGEEDTTENQGQNTALTEDFTIICTDRDSAELLEIAKSLRDEIKARTGYELKISYATSGSEKELVLGYVYNREACKAAYDGLGGADYRVYAAENTIVLAANSLNEMAPSIDLFLNQALTQTGDGWTVASCSGSTGEAFAIDGNLSGYTIVYPAGDSYYESLANELKVYLFDTFGAMVGLSNDKREPSGKEFIIGKTDRGFPGQQMPEGYQWAVAAKDGSVYLYGENAATAGLAVQDFMNNALSGIAPKVLHVKEREYIRSTIDTEDDPALASGAELRIMSYNILHESWSNVEDSVPVAPRAVKLTALLTYYRPDVVGILEVSSDWHDYLDRFLVSTGLYTKACSRTNSGKDNLTCFLYNPETVKLLDSYIIDMDANSNIRLIAVAVFERLENGEQFVVTNTHPAPTNQEAYPKHIDFLVDQFASIQETNKNLPIIMTGDFNTKESTSYYQTLLTMPVSDAKYSAETLVRNYESFLSPRWGGSPLAGDQKSLDHIFCTDDVRVLLFNTIIDNQVDTISDHLPIYADIILN